MGAGFLINKLKFDYSFKTRYKEYASYLQTAKDNGYSFFRLCDADGEDYKNAEKTVLLRHDVDGDLKIAKKMFKVEKSLQVKSSYYFREKTVDLKFIKELLEFGNEVGYHFEELSDYAYRNNLSDRTEIENAFPIIRENFENNLKKFREKTGSDCVTVVSHGDFVNRKVLMANYLILDGETKVKNGILHEGYDKSLLDPCKYCADCDTDFKGKMSFDDSDRYYVLFHSRQTAGSPLRVFTDLARAFKGVKYRVGCKLHKKKVKP